MHLFDQIFVCYANSTKSKELSEQISQWIVEGIPLAFNSKGFPLCWVLNAGAGI